MQSLETLLEEHRSIERMLDVLVSVAAELDGNVAVPPDTVDALLRFFQQVADGVHHSKEERQLFPMLAVLGVKPDESVIAPLLHQHDASRFHVQGMRKDLERLRRGDRDAGHAFALGARAYAELIREHIRIEEELLYPMAARVMTEEDDRSLCASFADQRQLEPPFDRAAYDHLLSRYGPGINGHS